MKKNNENKSVLTGRNRPILVGKYIDVGNLKGYRHIERDIPEGTVVGYGGIYPIVHRKLTARF